MNREVAFILSKLCESGKARKSTIIIKRSKNTIDFLNLLYKHGFIAGFKITGFKIEVYLKYTETGSTVQLVKLYSLPSRRLFISYNDLIKKHSLDEFTVLSTTKGYLTLIDAYQLGVGGQIICTIK